MGKSADGKAYVIAGTWDPNNPAFQALNEDTPKGKLLVLLVLIQYCPVIRNLACQMTRPLLVRLWL